MKTHAESLNFMYVFQADTFPLSLQTFQSLNIWGTFIKGINSRGWLSSDGHLILFSKFHYTGISGLIVLQDVPSNAAGEELPFLSKDDWNYYMQDCKGLFYVELNWLEWRHAFFLIKINPDFRRKLSLHIGLSYEMIFTVITFEQNKKSKNKEK